MATENVKITLPKFLQIVSNGLPMTKAMALAKTIYKQLDTTAKLADCSDAKLVSWGISSKDDRQNILKSIRKAGYSAKPEKLKGKDIPDPLEAASSPSLKAGSAVHDLTTPTKKRKRNKGDSVNEFLPAGPPDDLEAASVGSLDFGEVLDEAVLLTKATISNRAPVMMAWATVVVERMGFEREDALSIASAYAEMNALSKGVSQGRYGKGKALDLDAKPNGSQPYVELMNRRPLYQSHNNRWRALLRGTPVAPSGAFSYISRAFRQTMPYVLGAMMLLASSYAPKELNNKAWSLYADFRPPGEGWGEKSEMHCRTILDLRKKDLEGTTSIAPAPIAPIVENIEAGKDRQSLPMSKKPRTLTLEEYEQKLEEEADIYGSLEL